MGGVGPALERASAELGLGDLQTSNSANAALAAVAASSGKYPHLLELPGWVRMPSRYQRNWIQYTLVAVAGTTAVIFVVRSEPLS